ncbi:MAG: hypothetical protein PHZ00_06920 [Candidatus Peribacteraceae bacterium]|nr:hypothetical protein [Candidatus Peribacteraceae bacterium]
MDNRYASDPATTTTPAVPTKGNDREDPGAFADDETGAKPMREDRKLRKM